MPMCSEWSLNGRSLYLAAAALLFGELNASTTFALCHYKNSSGRWGEHLGHDCLWLLKHLMALNQTPKIQCLLIVALMGESAH